MKDKNTAGILALIFGVFGVHRFYLGQKGYGILYCLLAMFTLFTVPAILGFIDALVFFTTDQESFDFKYNRSDRERRRYYPHDENFDRRHREYRRGYREERRDYREERRRPAPRKEQRPAPVAPKKSTPKPRRKSDIRVRPTSNPFRQEGVKKFQEYDYYGAIEAFEKALEINPQDIAVHFNLACSYSLLEKKDKSFFHLDRAVAYGLKDFKRINEHDALAWLRIQDEFDDFKDNGFRLKNTKEKKEIASDNLLETTPDLLEQLKKLSELRKRGLLTEAEFSAQKRKLMG